MKQLLIFIFTALLLCQARQAMSQTQKGQLHIFGQTGLDFAVANNKHQIGGQNTNNYKTKNLALNFGLGYFYKENAFIGIATDLKTSKAISTPVDGSCVSENQTNTQVIGPIAGYYFPFKPELKPYFSVGVYYDHKSGTTKDTECSGILYEANIGIAYFIRKSISLDAQMSYCYGNLVYKTNRDHKIKDLQLYPSAGISLFF